MGRLDYLKQYQSENTVRSYKTALGNFFEAMYGERDGLEELAERYFLEDRDYEKDVQTFLVAMKNMAPKSQRLQLSSLRIFLLENKVELSQGFWRRLRGRVKGSRALTQDKVPSNVQLRKIMMHLPVHGKALYLTLSSSGMRIDEALQLKIEDLGLDLDPVRVNIRGEYTKTGNPRFTFISRESKEAIGEWLKVRDEYLKAAVGKSHMYDKSVEDPRLFPFTGTNARVMWNNALEKSGNSERDQSTNIHKVHPHVLRKFFRSQMGTVIPVDVAEALMGHEGYLTEVYRKYPDPEKTLAEFYKKGVHVLLVFAEAEEVTKLRKEMEERDRELQARENYLIGRLTETEEKVKRLKEEISDMRKSNEIREERFTRFMEILARSKNLDEAIDKFRRLGETTQNPKRTTISG